MPPRRPQAHDLSTISPWAGRLRAFTEALPERELARARSVCQLVRQPSGCRLTREDLAASCGLSRWRVKSLLAGRGRQPNLLELLVLSRSLGVSVDELSVALVGAFARRIQRLYRE